MSKARTDDVEAVAAANTALYDALEHGDLQALSDCWLGEEKAGVSVVHPGWPVLNGRAEVLRSYATIMANHEYIQFFLTDVEISVLGDTALVTCTENILTGGPAQPDGSAGPLVGGVVVATNIFRRAEDRSWKVWAHHASPVLADGEDAPAEAQLDDVDGIDGIDGMGGLGGIDETGDVEDIADIADVADIADIADAEDVEDVDGTDDGEQGDGRPPGAP
ncbi:Ketosteroid isomerase homolog [Streptomyces aidingensis]|uniref:Ketosteroid isomerase homolog n=1 Tax=Streptomyces aidingensis TaxID=910347 RepID=A0A1I1R449_9ACTN|nr:Ketosteroid isomerase homolog [Streptomyces aidingensis]